MGGMIAYILGRKLPNGGKALILGNWPECLAALLVSKWSAVWCNHEHPSKPKGNWPIEYVECELGPDPHFRKMLDGVYRKASTPQEIFNQFPGPYDFISIDVESMSRLLWYKDEIQKSLPLFYALPEDGHNEEVIAQAKGMKYEAKEQNGTLYLLRRG